MGRDNVAGTVTVFLVYWLPWLVAFPLLEGYALWRRTDQVQPLTYYVRWFMAYSWVFRAWVLVGVAWLFLHFAFGVG